MCKSNIFFLFSTTFLYRPYKNETPTKSSSRFFPPQNPASCEVNMKRIMIILSCPAIVGCSRLSHREVIRMQGIPGFTLQRMPGHIMLFVGVVDDTIYAIHVL